MSGNSSFADLGLNTWLVKQCRAIGLAKATAVQEKCIPPILQGQNCIGCAKTGSGKTAAFALPILQNLAKEPFGIYALILTPTRELAFQLADQFRAFGKPIGMRDAIVIGGLDIISQSIALSKKPHIVIATPGRLADLIDNDSKVHFSKIKFLVLDEADRLLEASFGPDLGKIFEILPEDRQTLLFSATMTNAMARAQEVAASKKPFIYEDTDMKISATVEQLDQHYLLMPAVVKDCYFVYLIKQLSLELEKNPRWNMMIFTSTYNFSNRRSCQILAIMLSRLEFSCAALHSLMPQRQRLGSLARFKNGLLKILVATDVASRGLDIPTVEAVVNYNVPLSADDYIHRVGRTARAGKKGMAVTLMTQYDVNRIHNIETTTNVKLLKYEVDEHDVLKLLNIVTMLRKEIDVRLEESNFGRNRELNKRKMTFLSKVRIN
ncbi:uncharacterized protein TRIADDRAFT_21982 [Trichoplax adhaerens]|uniref:RNA helicase n=1 Tax=Trichoplax adhaerens TaxID=10228 RepID=B3RRU3_TRIAD|nr:hypothetical protein TRIADDRAFT_21982 [Trichoplax adhaerens]EDV26931.1 hypothetical protein TRIADDRAFT_21982 [Trichoplax adhaerens]|eukprot:XP_002110927.1 hypothetical protein TRIADDRAFT_21982 [Trichoplax adhaerens]